MQTAVTTMFAPYCIAGIGALGLCVYLLQKNPFRSSRLIATIGLVFLAAIGLFFHLVLKQHGRDIPFDTEHYYLGAKYYKELGYKYLYPAYAQALKEQTGQEIPFIRDVSDSSNCFPTNQYIALELEAKNQFSPARWSAFTNDVISDTAMTADPRHIWFANDHGYTGSPWLTLELQPFTLIPLVFRGVLLSIDFIIFGLTLYLLGSYFGWVNTLAGLVAYLFFPPGDYSFSLLGFSLLRFLWVFWLVASLIAFKKQSWALAGILFGIATLDRIFPVFFAFAAIWVMTLQSINRQGTLAIKLKPCLQITGYFTVTILMGVCITETLWPGHWLLQFAFLKDLSIVPFAPAFGWLKVIHFYPVDRFVVQGTGLTDGLVLYYDKAATLVIHQRLFWPFYLAWSAFTTATLCILSPFRLKPLVAVTLIGFFLIFQFATLSHYYLVLDLILVCIFLEQDWRAVNLLIVPVFTLGAIILCYGATGIAFCFLSLLLALFFTGTAAWFIFKDHHRYMVSLILMTTVIGVIWFTRHDFIIQTQLKQEYEHNIQRENNNISGVRTNTLEYKSLRLRSPSSV